MKKLATYVVAAIALIGTPAFAADMAVKAPPPPPPAPVYSWTGWYVGLNAGGAWGDKINNSIPSSFCNPILGGCPGGGAVPGFNVAIAQAVPPSFDSRLRGFIGGGQIGYNYQTGQAVWGIEADFQGVGLKGSASAANTEVASIAVPSFVTVASAGSQKLDFLGTLRGRLGWTPSAPWLVYVTGGLAYGHTETSASFSEGNDFPANSAASIDAWRAGWTIAAALNG